MKKGKRALALLLTAVMALGCLTACGGKGNSASGNDKNYNKRKEIKVAYWRSGHGIKWLENMKEAFEEKYTDYRITITESASKDAVKSAWTIEDTDETDLYLVTKDYETKYMEPLDGLLDKTLDGDQKTLREKFNADYLEYEQSADGHYYTLTYGGGVIGLFYNTEMFKEAGVTQLPRTTEEWVVVCDKLSAKGYTPLCHFNASGIYGYYDYVNYLYMQQYSGVDYVHNNFWRCTDENGTTPSKTVFTAEDGRYHALKAYEKLVTPEYTLLGSNTKSHTEVQTEFLNDRAAMLVNGSWMMTEMASVGITDKISEMRIPVLSAITDRLSTVKSDSDLRKLITAIDQVTDEEKKLEDFVSGDGYAVEGMTVSKEDWDIVYEARNTVPCNVPEESLWIPKYANEKEGAMKFLEFLYSDEGYKIYTTNLKTGLPMTLSTGEAIDTSDWTELDKFQLKYLDSAVEYASDGLSDIHRIFIDGGASPFAGITFINKFSAQNKEDRMTANEVWKTLINTVETKYEGSWLENIK